MPKWSYTDAPDQTGRRVVITGANVGLGLALAKDYIQRTQVEKVILACRSKERAEAAIADIGGDPRLEFLALDLADLESVRRAADELGRKYDRIDTLVLNAGLLPADGKHVTKQGFEMTIGVCHLGHFAFTARVWPLLLKSTAARVVSVSSVAHTWTRKGLDLEDLQWERRKFDRMEAYSQAKLANIYFTKELARRTEAAGVRQVTVTSCNPGFGNTAIYRSTGGCLQRFLSCIAADPEKLSLNTFRAASDARLENGGYLTPKRFDAYGPPVVKRTSKLAEDADMASRLWAKSEEVTGEAFPVEMGPVA